MTLTAVCRKTSLNVWQNIESSINWNLGVNNHHAVLKLHGMRYLLWRRNTDENNNISSNISKCRKSFTPDWNSYVVCKNDFGVLRFRVNISAQSAPLRTENSQLPFLFHFWYMLSFFLSWIFTRLICLSYSDLYRHVSQGLFVMQCANIPNFMSTCADSSWVESLVTAYTNQFDWCSDLSQVECLLSSIQTNSVQGNGLLSSIKCWILRQQP